MATLVTTSRSVSRSRMSGPLNNAALWAPRGFLFCSTEADAAEAFDAHRRLFPSRYDSVISTVNTASNPDQKTTNTEHRTPQGVAISGRIGALSLVRAPSVFCGMAERCHAMKGLSAQRHLR